VTVVAFDLDGCLVESRAAILPSLRVALVAHGLPALPDGDLAFLIGPPLEAGITELLVSLDADPAMARSIVQAYRADYREHMLEQTTLVDGMAEVVRGVERACIVTSKPAALATPIVAHLGLLDALDFVEGPSLDMEMETKVETLARATCRLPSLSVMVGDRHHDVEAGRAHGIRTVGVLWGMGDAFELAGADVLVETPAALAEVLA
jgi:phosphoglycolate phosphatase